MGNHRFKLSDIMPNAWFYKIRDMGNSRNRNHSISNKKQPTPVAVAATATTQPSKPKQPHHSCPRKSYYYTRELIPNEHRNHSPKASDTHSPDPPRKSSKRRIKKRSLRSPKPVSSSVSAGCSCRASLWTKPEYPPDYLASLSDSPPGPESLQFFQPEFRCDHVLTTDSSFDKLASLSSCNFDSNVEDVVIGVDKKSLESKFSEQIDLFDKISDLDLPPIITKVENVKKKPTKQEEKVSVKEHKQQSGSVKKHSVNSPGLRIRVNSPKVGGRRIQGRKSMLISSSFRRRSLSDSMAIVKSSMDPQRDFRESMVEMILENNIKGSKDLEDLLACYLSLNSDEYHELIIKVFKQIWFDLTNTHPN